MSLLTIQDLKSTTPLFQYSEDDLQEILKAHGKTPKTLLEDVKIIKDWLKTQPHLPIHPSERQIASFLVNNKCLIEKTKQKTDMFFTIRSLITDFYQEIYPKSKRVQEGLKYTNVIFLPKLTKDLSRVMIVRHNPHNEATNTETILALAFMFLELTSLVDFSNGYEIIFDLTHITFTLAAKCTPMVLKKCLTVLENVYSGRVKALRIINIPKALEFLIDMVISVFKDKLKSRLEFLQGFDKLKEMYGEENLPIELGGKGDSIFKMQTDYMRLLETHDDYFEKLQRMKIDERLRPEKLQNDDFLGYYGNFKKIDID